GRSLQVGNETQLVCSFRFATCRTLSAHRIEQAALLKFSNRYSRYNRKERSSRRMSTRLSAANCCADRSAASSCAPLTRSRRERQWHGGLCSPAWLWWSPPDLAVSEK